MFSIFGPAGWLKPTYLEHQL